MPLLVHGEVTHPDVDVFDREARFIDEVLAPLRAAPAAAAHRVRACHHAAQRCSSCARSAQGVAATITPQHLLMNRNALFQGGIRPHHYCLPVLKRERDRDGAARRGGGRRSALLPRHRQRAACAQHQGNTPAAAPASIPRMPRWSSMPRSSSRPAHCTRLEAFASEFGPRFYGLPLNDGSSRRCSATAWTVPAELSLRRRRARAAARRRDAALAPRQPAAERSHGRT